MNDLERLAELLRHKETSPDFIESCSGAARDYFTAACAIDAYMRAVSRQPRWSTEIEGDHVVRRAVPRSPSESRFFKSLVLTFSAPRFSDDGRILDDVTVDGAGASRLVRPARGLAAGRALAGFLFAITPLKAAALVTLSDDLLSDPATLLDQRFRKRGFISRSGHTMLANGELLPCLAHAPAAVSDAGSQIVYVFQAGPQRGGPSGPELCRDPYQIDEVTVVRTNGSVWATIRPTGAVG